MHIVVAGGFTESKGSLERVADEAVKVGLGHDAEDQAFPMRLALGRKNEKFRKAVRGAHVITHSAGALALLDVEGVDMITLVAPPEPRSVIYLAAAAVKKTKNHLIGRTDNARLDHLRVTAGNTYELSAHLLGNARHLGKISSSSTISALVADRIAAPTVGYFPQREDEFFAAGITPMVIVRLGHLTDTAAELQGRHDQLLVNPADTLAQIQTAYALSGEPSAA